MNYQLKLKSPLVSNPHKPAGYIFLSKPSSSKKPQRQDVLSYSPLQKEAKTFWSNSLFNKKMKNENRRLLRSKKTGSMLKIEKRTGNLSISRKDPTINKHPLACTQLFSNSKFQKSSSKNYSFASLDQVNKGLQSKIIQPSSSNKYRNNQRQLKKNSKFDKIINSVHNAKQSLREKVRFLEN